MPLPGRVPSLAAFLPTTVTTALTHLLLALLAADGARAHPYAKDDLHDAGFGYLMPRGCDTYCGYDNQVCCPAGGSCYTSSGIALCEATGGGGYALYTTTWTETETFTSTISSLIPATTAASGNCVPPADSGWIACGQICCASWQYCAFDGQCSANNAGWTAPATTGAVYTTTAAGVAPSTTTTVTTQYSAPYRVTSGTATSTVTGTLESATASGNATLTGASTAASLSPGAIAGIVVGVVGGVFLLLLLCACFVVRNLWNGLLALLGLGPRRRRREEVIIEEERYTRHGSVHSRRDRHDGWFAAGAAGGRPSTVASRREREREKMRRDSAGGGGGGRGAWLGLGAAGATLLLLLGLRRDKKRRATAVKTRSEVSSSYWSDSYTASSPSSRSSDRRTSNTRRTRETTTRVSRAPSRR